MANKGQMNFLRLAMAILDHLSQILRDLLMKETKPSTLYNDVQSCPYLAKSLSKAQKGIIKKTKDYSEFDNTLLYTLLRNLPTSLGTPTNGWNCKSMPGPGENKVEDDIERIRFLRNNIYGHVASSSVPDQDFQNHWSVIMDISSRMEHYMGSGYGYVQKLKSLETCVIDECMLQKCITLVHDMSIQKEIKENFDMIMESLKNLQEKETSTGFHHVQVLGDSSVIFGQDAEFTAVISNTLSVLSVKWQHVDGDVTAVVPIRNPKYDGSSEDTTMPKLIVKNVDFSDDKNVFQLTVLTERGCYVSNKVLLNVTGNRPVIILKNRTQEDHSLVLECEFSVTPDSPAVSSVVWKHNDVDIKVLESCGKFTGSDVSEPSLKIHHVDENDAGNYQCFVSNAIGTTESDQLYLGTPLCKIEGQSSVIYGQKAQFIAEVKSCSKIDKLEWKITKDDEEMSVDITNVKYHGSSSDLPTPMLVLNKASFDDGALYHLTASNLFGEGRSGRIELNVTGERPIIFTSPPVEDVDDVLIRCSILVKSDSPSLSTVKWLKDDIQIRSNYVYNKNENYVGTPQEYSLRISQPSDTDKGEYKCIAENDVGNVISSSMCVDVPIIILSGPTTSDLGENVTLYATLSSNMNIKSYTWQRFEDDVAVGINIEGNKYAGSYVSKIDATLVINAANLSDSGVYVLKATNIIGEGKSNPLSLTVKDDSILQLPIEYQCVLCCILLTDGENYSHLDEDWLEIYRIVTAFFNYESKDRDEIKTLVKSEIIQKYTKEHDEVYVFISKNVKNNVFLSLSKKSGFIDFFLRHGSREIIGEYCRTPNYTKRKKEVCYILNMEQTEIMIDRLKLEILTHCTLEDFSIHSYVASKLKIPEMILKWGKEGLENFKKHLSAGCQQVFHARGMIVGCSKAGKTTLLRRLQNLPLDDIKSTRGVEIHANVFTVVGNSLQVSKDATSVLNVIPSTLTKEDLKIMSERVDAVDSLVRENVVIPDRKQEKSYIHNSKDIHQETIKDTKTDLESDEKQKDSHVFENTDNYGKMESDNETNSGNEERINEVNSDSNEMDGESIGKEIQNSEKSSQKKINDSNEVVDNRCENEDEGISVHSDVNINADSDGQADVLELIDTQRKKKIGIHSDPYFSSFMPNVFKSNVTKSVTILDFAGQCAYYACHQAYLSPRAFYIIVMNIKKHLEELVGDDECDQKDSMFRKWKHKNYFQYWMKMIHTYSSTTAPVIVVCTHCENITEMEKDDFFAKLLKAIPEEIADGHISTSRKFFIQLNEDRNLNEIKECIVNLIEKQPFWGENHPSLWVLFERKVQEMKKTKKVIDTEDMWIENKKMNEEIRFKKAEDMRPMFRFFHDIGIILYFDDEYLRDMIVLDVQWFVDTFKHIITDEHHAKNDLDEIREWQSFNETGELGEELLHAIWKQENQDYMKHKTRVLLYMERLGILAEMKNRKTLTKKSWYVPCVNKLNFPSKDFKEYHVSQILCFQFTFLPSVIFYRLITGCMNILKFAIVTENSKPCIYQTATLFISSTDENHYILIGMYENAIEIQVLVPPGLTYNKDVGIGVKDKIANILDDITRTFHSNLKEVFIGIKCKRAVFGQQNSHFIPLSTVQTLTTYVCPKCKFSERKKMNVQKVLSYWFKDGKVPTATHLAEYCEICLKKTFTHRNPSPVLSDSERLIESNIRQAEDKEKKDKGLVKCCIIGDGTIGKTAIYYSDPYNQPYINTVFDTVEITVLMDDDQYQLHIYDTAGPEDYDRLRPLAYPNTDVFIVCFSIVQPASCTNVTYKWLPEIRHFCPDVPFILVGTKIDLRNSGESRFGWERYYEKPLTSKYGQELAKACKAVRYMECSGLTKEGVEELYREAVRVGLEKQRKDKLKQKQSKSLVKRIFYKSPTK